MTQLRVAFASLIVVVASSIVPGARARERDSEAALATVVRVESDLLAAAELARSSNLRAQQSAAAGLGKAAATFAAALEAVAKLPAPTGEAEPRPTVTVRQALVNAELAHADARESLERLLAEASRLDAVVEERRARVDALAEGLGSLRKAMPPPGPMEGDWVITFVPAGAEPLTLHLTQDGPLVAGAATSGGVAAGSVAGRFAAGQIRLERYDESGVKQSDLTGQIVPNGELQGTWQSTVLGTGRPGAGTFAGKRVAAGAP